MSYFSFKKIAKKESSPEEGLQPKAVVIDRRITIFSIGYLIFLIGILLSIRPEILQTQPANNQRHLQDQLNLSRFVYASGNAMPHSAIENPPEVQMITDNFANCLRVASAAFCTHREFPLRLFESTQCLIALATDGRLFCLDRTTVKPLWSMALGQSVLGAPLIDNDTLYVLTKSQVGRAFVVSLSLKNGEIQWLNSQFKDKIPTSLQFNDLKQVVVSSYSEQVRTLDAKSGKRLN